MGFRLSVIGFRFWVLGFGVESRLSLRELMKRSMDMQ